MPKLTKTYRVEVEYDDKRILKYMKFVLGHTRFATKTNWAYGFRGSAKVVKVTELRVKK